MDNGGAIEDAADETASSNGKALISDKEEEMAMNDGETDDNLCTMQRQDLSANGKVARL
jgi:hypothetical protein